MRFIKRAKTELLLSLLKNHKLHHNIIPFVEDRLEKLHHDNKEWLNAKKIKEQILNNEWYPDVKKQGSFCEGSFHTLKHKKLTNQIWICNKGSDCFLSDYSHDRDDKYKFIDTLGVFKEYVWFFGFKELYEQGIKESKNIKNDLSKKEHKKNIETIKRDIKY